jgi:hypothetical protein
MSRIIFNTCYYEAFLDVGVALGVVGFRESERERARKREREREKERKREREKERKR